jgi:hypothetical protein
MKKNQVRELGRRKLVVDFPPVRQQALTGGRIFAIGLKKITTTGNANAMHGCLMRLTAQKVPKAVHPTMSLLLQKISPLIKANASPKKM